MNARPFTAFIVVLFATAMNVTRQVQKGKDPFVPLLSGLILGTLFVGIDDITQENLGTLLALIFFMSSTLTSGVAIMESLTQLAESN